MENDSKKPPATNAERQRSHRQRVKNRLAGLAPPPVAPRKAPPEPSRPKRLAAIERELSSLLGEYDDWLQALPENLAASDNADRLQETIGHLQAALDAVEAIDPPRVGRR